MVETFNGAKIWWTHTVQGRKLSDGSSQDHRMYTLKMHKGDRDRVMPAYLDSIHENAHEYQRQNRLPTKPNHQSLLRCQQIISSMYELSLSLDAD